MGSNNKLYRIRTTVGREADSFLDVHLDQDYDSLEILSLKISDKDVYKLHNSDYGVIVGRVLANGNFGVPNAKISIFIEADEQNSDMKMWNLYPYTSTSAKNDKDIRYNLLPDESVKDCHKAVGTFPHKTFLLENDSLLEVFDKYYVYTTRTNAAGDYLICGVPTGMQTLHMDLDLSDCGILSQRPRDFVYKGYTIEQFDNPNQFKKDENIDGLSQIFSQNQPVYVKPFWGNEDNGDEIGITRADIEISFKFEPTCVFMGSAISDNASNGVGKKCVPTNQMGAMDELTAGEGTIEMIRKTPAGNVEEFSIKGNQLIDGNGVWCYQIPMNLDYMMTDEYGNMVPTDDPEKGIPTRTRVRFRASLTDMENSSQSYYRAKYLIPNNPRIDDNKVDYNFGTYTEEDSYRDLFWNGVYTVKSYIPRFQKSKRWKNERFSGIKACNYYGGNNPMPYNNLRIKLPFMFTVLCIFVKLFIKIVAFTNRIIAGIIRIFFGILGFFMRLFMTLGGGVLSMFAFKKIKKWADGAASDLINNFIDKYSISCTFIGDGLCPDMEGWYFAPGCGLGVSSSIKERLLRNTLYAATGSGTPPGDTDTTTKEVIKSTEFIDETSTDTQNTSTNEEESACITVDVDYLMNCFEMNLAQEYRVIKFDFYNDWVNGVIYFPRWMRKIKRKKKYKFSLKKGTNFITTYYRDKVQGCMNSENSTVKKTRYYTQQCSLAYKQKASNSPYNIIGSLPACYSNPKTKRKNKIATIVPTKCHKQQGMTQFGIFGKKSGLVTEETTMLGQYVYYLKPCEWKDTKNGGKTRVLLFATDIVLLGTLNDCDENGIPQAFKFLNNSTYIMPTNLALTTMDDDSYIYANGDGTVCSSRKYASENQKTRTTLNRITPDYKSTSSAYSNTDGDQVEYGENDDPIPVTEAAGITWNYSGPGQEDVASGKLEKPSDLLERLFGSGIKNRFKYLYYPGGHFLGLSCVNSETNIKSCVNLKRICELGATMSQRREELRGYDADGKPYYRYYVPTGLISNVDIETASFRSMFATMNHNSLIANRVNEDTGYKTYTFRFLRPDGFDGALTDYVHRRNSPYNKKINDGTDVVVADSTSWFKKAFKGLWSEPYDYDKYEAKFTERRTVEDSVNDYFMFRFGLDNFSDKEQKKHFLEKNGYGLLLPQYENSFYFYFGLKDGSTALDEFKKQFFSECETNNVMKAPVLNIKEKISKDLSETEATLLIDNMIGPFSISISDDTTGEIVPTFTSESDVLDLGDRFSYRTMRIGHTYTVTVVDSIEQTISKTFIFGAAVIKIPTETIHFRQKSTGIATNSAKKGGYFKVNDSIEILKEAFSISGSNGAISFEFRKINEDTKEETIVPSDSIGYSNYTDKDDEFWHMYFLPEKGTYNMYLRYSGSVVSVYTSSLEDNENVNIYVACNYLSYKPDLNPDFDDTLPEGPDNPKYMPSKVLSGVTDEQWKNSSGSTGLFGDSNSESWLMRHTFYRQTSDDTAGYDHYIYASGKNNVAVFGQPENIDSLSDTTPPSGATGFLADKSYYQNDYDEYAGYSLDDKYSFIPTMYWNNGQEDPRSVVYRNMFDAMSYSDDGRAAADATNITITDYTFTPEDETGAGKVTLQYTGTAQGISSGHGCIVVFEDGSILFPVIEDGNRMVGYSDFNIYQTLGDDQEKLSQLLAMATVYPTMRVPSFYKPFYGEITAVTWAGIGAEVSVEAEDNVYTARKEKLPEAYKIAGSIYNGLTYNGRFYPGIIPEGQHEVTSYDTYFIFKEDGRFWWNLSANTAEDYKPKKSHQFTIDRREGEINDDTEGFDEITYSVKENVPPNSEFATKPNVFTGRYEGGFDQTVLTDSCLISECFYDDIKTKILDEQAGLNGRCMFYTEESKIEGMKVYLTKANLFTYSTPIVAKTDGGTFCCGYYNENAKFDKKGSYVTVRVQEGIMFLFPITDENGTTKLASCQALESKLYDMGITLFHGYNFAYPNATLPELVSLLDNAMTTGTTGNAIEINLKYKGETEEEGTIITNPYDTYNAIIQVYTKPQEGSKNKMTIYRLMAIKSFDVVYPLNPGGIEPYIAVNGVQENYPSTTGMYSVQVTTNVDFNVKVPSGVNWIRVQGTQPFSKNTGTVMFSLDENTASSQRNVTVTFESVDEVKYDPATETMVKYTMPITIRQLGN